MANDRFKEWLGITKELVNDAHDPCVADATGKWWFITKAVVFALLTIAIAIHEAANKGVK